MTTVFHQPVLLDKVADLLVHDPTGIYVDATLGGGGHAKEILNRLTTGRLIGFDCDSDAIRWCQEHVNKSSVLVHARFSNLYEKLLPLAPSGVQGVLFDLGVSSFQLENSDRGFSYLRDGPLDCRMDATSGRTAAALMNELSRQEIRRLLRTYGEEPQAARIAAAIDHARKREPIHTTQQLAKIIEASVPAAGIKALARTFQALRITVNNELEELDLGLEGAWKSLASGGHLVVLAYHSLESRRVKAFFADKTRGCTCPPNLPVCSCGGQAQAVRLIRRAIRPTLSEIRANPRARSAQLRAIEKFQLI